MTRVLEFWFDFSCPFAYLASTRVEALAARVRAEVVGRPLLLGGVFKTVGAPQKLFQSLGPAKAKHNQNDMRRHASVYGVPLRTPEGHPIRTVEALRSLLAVGEPFMPLAHRFFRAYWVDGIDLGTEDGVARVLREAGHDPIAVRARAESQEIKEDLRRRTDEGIARGIFGVPAFFVEGELFWGQDRLDFVEEALGGVPESMPPADRVAPMYPVDFYFDYSSPFSYIASERAERMVGRALRWKPFLLGGLFKTIGAPDVPFFTQSEPKRKHTVRDLDRQAARGGIPFRWPSRFPMNTVLALRVTLAAFSSEPERTPVLLHRLFRAYWAEDLDISDAGVVERLSTEAGFDGAALVGRASHPEVKDALRRATDEAVLAGVFGAPTFVVHPGSGRDPALYWGADRLDLATRAARGDERVL